MLKYWWSLLLVALVACSGSDGITTPPPTDQPVAVVQPVAAPPVPETVVTVGSGWEGSILPMAGWSVRNTSSASQSFTAYWTDFDNQALPRGSKSMTVRPNDVFEGSFNLNCVQVDLTYGVAGAAPFLFGYINADGKVVKSITDADRTACSPKPQPSPSPSPSPTPCAETWTPLPAVEENTSEWSKCTVLTGASVVPMCNALQTQTYELVIYEKNSCTAEKREKSRTKQSRTKDCSFTPTTTNAGHLVLVADQGEPRSGKSSKDYNVYREVDGPDVLIWHGKLAKGETVNIPVFGFTTGDKWYVRYDDESYKEYTTATCTIGVQKNWHPVLDFVCDKSTSCIVPK
jgi:hypothetical protein